MSELERVMVDLETLGLEPGSSILSIGAVRFDTNGIVDGQTFYRNVSLESCTDAGLEIDVSTLDWWLNQDGDVQGILTGGERLSKVLFAFSRFYDDADEIWAFSPSFDCAILSEAYAAVDETEPWTYRDERDCRTLASLPVWPDNEQEGNEHDALDDAIYQAKATAKALHWIERGGAAHE
jgi:hypothetical protein